MSEGIEFVCACCELTFALGETLSGRGGREEKKVDDQDGGPPAVTAREKRSVREQARGVRLTFAKNRITDIEFLAGPAAGKRAAQLPDMELKRLALSMPHRTARFAIRRYLRNRKKGRVPTPDDAVIRR